MILEVIQYGLYMDSNGMSHVFGLVPSVQWCIVAHGLKKAGNIEICNDLRLHDFSRISRRTIGIIDFLNRADVW